jgi:hypothetical protein
VARLSALALICRLPGACGRADTALVIECEAKGRQGAMRRVHKAIEADELLEELIALRRDYQTAIARNG